MRYPALAITLLAFAAAVASEPAAAELVLSKVVLDFDDAAQTHDDIEIFNAGDERLFIVVEPAEIVAAGTAHEQRTPVSDPEASGLLVSPKRIVLEPHERRVARVSLLGPSPAHDRVYRLAIKPVVGAVTADVTALKVLIGYDALIIRRPDQITGTIESERRGDTLVVRNATNTAREFYDGSQCDADGGNCAQLPARRLYAGEEWQVALPYDTPVRFKTAWGKRADTVEF